MPSPTTKAHRRRGFNIPPLDLKPILEISEEVVTFADYSFKFPLPPGLPRSPRVSPSSSPASQNGSLPLTPTSSDEEFGSPLLPSRCSKKRAAIKPLVITKLPRSEARRLPIIDRSESDSEWYSRELSKILDTTPSPTYFPAAHRDSFSVAPPISCHPFANQSCRPLPRMSIPDDVCSLWVDAEPSPWSSMYSAVSTPLTDRAVEVDGCPILSLSLPVSPFLDPDMYSPNVVEEQQQLSDLWFVGGGDQDDRLSFAFVFEDAEDDRRDEKSIQLVTPKTSSSLHPICTPSPPLSSSPPPSSSPTPRPLPPLPTSVPLVPLRPQRCSTMTSISSLSIPPSPILSRESLPNDGDGDGDNDERRYGLKSRWSSSTLGEEHEVSSILNASKKLKTYFRGTKRTSSTVSSSPSSSSSATKISIPSPIKFRGKEQKNKKKKKAERRGHGGGGELNDEGLEIRPQDSFLPRVEEEETRFRTGLGRSCEVVPVSCSFSSSRKGDFLDISSSGGGRRLRRKPIPEEMLVRAG